MGHLQYARIVICTLLVQLLCDPLYNLLARQELLLSLFGGQ